MQAYRTSGAGIRRLLPATVPGCLLVYLASRADWLDRFANDRRRPALVVAVKVQAITVHSCLPCA